MQAAALIAWYVQAGQHRRDRACREFGLGRVTWQYSLGGGTGFRLRACAWQSG